MIGPNAWWIPVGIQKPDGPTFKLCGMFKGTFTTDVPKS